MVTFLKQIWSLLEKKEKFFFFFLLVLMSTGAYLELMGIGLVLPIIAALTNPVLLQDNKLLNLIYRIVAPSSNKQFMLVMCLLVSGLFFIKTVFFLFLTKLQAGFSNRISKKMEERLFAAYVKAPYLYHLNKNSAEIFSNLNQMKSSFPAFFTSIMLLITEFICITFIFISLFIFTPGATLAVLFVAAAGLFFIVFVVKRYGNELGKQEYSATIQANKIIMETFTSMKEVKLYGCENNFAALHSNAVARQKKFSEKIAVFNQAPRFVIEFIMVAGAMLLLIAFIFFNVSNTSILLKLSLICIALIRLMPSFSRIQYNYTNVKILAQSFDGILFDLFNIPAENTEEKNTPFSFHNSIEVKNISFGYLPGKTILKDISFTIPKNSSCAFIGKTGCGKTTLADIITGLLQPSSGEIYVDDVPVKDNLKAWRYLAGYVPQHIHLFDDTIAANVAFGIKPEDVDHKKLEKCLKMAQAWDFVSALDQGVQTLIGENGLRLSGGQRQRLGIARALYHDPQFLVLDEATSALDNETEKAFMESIGFLQGKLTMLIIAHRLSTIKNCDCVIDLSGGRMQKKDLSGMDLS